MRVLPWIVGGWLVLTPPGLAGAETLARQIADREAVEERFRILQSSVDELMAAQLNLHRRLDALEQSMLRLAAEVRSKPGEDRVVSRREFDELAKAIQEVDRKREADRRQILEQIEELGRSLTAALREARAAAPVRVAPAESRGGATPQEGAEHTVQRGETLSAIIAAYNAEWKGRGRRTSLQLILDANPGLEPTRMAVGRKIFIPMVPER